MIPRSLMVLLLATSAAFNSLTAEIPPLLRLEPPEWKYGMISKGDIARGRVGITNLSEKDIFVEMISTCSCLSVEPISRKLASGASVEFDVAFDSADYEGIVSKYFIVSSDPPSPKPVFFILSGVVRADNGRSSASGDAGGGLQGRAVEEGASRALGGGAAAPPPSGPVDIRYYYAPGCRSCEKYLSEELPGLLERYGVEARIARRDMLDPGSYEELASFAASIGDTLRAAPALRVGSVLLQGEREIEEHLAGILAVGAYRAADGAARPSAESPPDSSFPVPGGGLPISIAAVVAAGLVDGVNPCAFTTLLFLLSSLALAGRGRREVLAIGLLFTLGVFLTYLGAGFGLFSALRAAGSVSIVSIILRWILVAVLAVLAALSLVDYARVRAGRPSDMVLQLPQALKLRIHASIRTRARTSALALSSLVLGFLVSVFEFACTGQVYLPTLAYIARREGGGAVLLLVLYNLCFVAPLLGVFGAAYFGVGSRRLTALFQRRMGATKIALAAVFAALAILTALT